MFKIVEKKTLAPAIYMMRVHAPRVAESSNPGQFVIVMADKTGERVPLTIADYDKEQGTVTVVIQEHLQRKCVNLKKEMSFWILWDLWENLQN